MFLFLRDISKMFNCSKNTVFKYCINILPLNSKKLSIIYLSKQIKKNPPLLKVSFTYDY